MPRIAPVERPFEQDVDAQLKSMMPAGVEPIGLFRTFAKNAPMTAAMHSWGGYELGRKLSLTMRDRELVIDRTCARCGCEYEWGVHIAFFAERVKLTRDQISSVTHGDSADPCWDSSRDRLLIRVADALHDYSDIDDDLWADVSQEFSEAEILDLTMLCGWYHSISFTARAARVGLEPFAPRFLDYAASVVQR